jgi:hypothetical protein
VTDADPLTSIDRLSEPGGVRMVVQSGRVVVDRDGRIG